MKILLILLVTLLSSSLYAQQSAVPMPDSDWAEDQHSAERAAYWHAIEMSGPDTNIAEARASGYKQFTSIPRSKAMMILSVAAWEQVGGSQDGVVSGRPTSIAFDPVNNQIFYLGTSGGGLWQTTNGGTNWVNLSNSWSSYAMGGVAVDQTDGNIIYACTGDLYDRTGDGFYKSTDRGLNWVLLAKDKIVGSRCNQVLIDPQVHTTIYITGPDGVRQSLDAGATWKHILSIGGSTHMVIDPTNGQNLYAAGGGMISKSVDGGATWTGDVASNISGKSTITLGISKKDVSKIYANIGSASNGGTLGLARSDDYGDTWTIVWNNGNYMSNQAWYDNACTVSPTNANTVIVGGLDIWNSTNGGSNLSERTYWQHGSSLTDYSHADIHVLQYGPLGLYALTDGGIFISQNNGGSWSQRMNANLSNMLFVGGDAAPDFSYIIGGAQDNGINGTAENGTTFKQTYGGDGGRCFISQEDGGQNAYSTYINAVLHKSADGGRNWGIDNIIPSTSKLLSEQAPFYMTYDVCEGDGAAVAIAGNNNVYYSNDGVNSLYEINSSNIGPRALHVASADENVVYAGTGGYVYVTQNAGDLTGVKWVKSATSIGAVSGFVSDPTNAKNAWATVSGFGGQHFWRTTDFGKTWVAPATNLSNLDAASIARAPNGDLFIGHTFGVMRSLDNGVTWEPLRDGIPLCQITKLRVRGTSSQWLLATTYGRGMFRLNINDLPRTIQNGVSSSAITTDMPAITSISPNPVQINSRSTINFKLAKEGSATLVLYDQLGREAKTLLKEFRGQGDQFVEADMSQLSSGVYYVVLTSDGHALTQKLVIAK